MGGNGFRLKQGLRVSRSHVSGLGLLSDGCLPPDHAAQRGAGHRAELAGLAAVRFTGRRSELLGDARLFQHGIGRVARQDGVINGEAPTVDRAFFPYFVIDLAPAYEMAVVIAEDRADLSAVATHHQAKRPDRCSTELAGSTRTPTRMITSKGTSSGLSRKSWIIAGSLATSASRLGASLRCRCPRSRRPRHWLPGPTSP
jgi:hypothetical protein